MRLKRPPQLVVEDQCVEVLNLDSKLCSSTRKSQTRSRNVYQNYENELVEVDGVSLLKSEFSGYDTAAKLKKKKRGNHLSSGESSAVYAVTRQKGSKRSHCEDSWNALPCIEQNYSYGSGKSAMFGVFDGHGGNSVSELCKRELLASLLSRSIQKPKEGVLECLRKTFLLVDSASKSGDKDEDEELCGSTATVAWFRNGQVNVASVGDSRAVMVRSNGQSIDLTRDHRAICDEEVVRIENAGGDVLMNRVNGVLSISRAIGDHCLKKYITAEPELVCREIDSSDEFLVIATDGLWDVVSSQEAAEYVMNRSKARSTSECWSLESISRELVDLAVKRGSSDDITVLIVDVKRNFVKDYSSETAARAINQSENDSRLFSQADYSYYDEGNALRRCPISLGSRTSEGSQESKEVQFPETHNQNSHESESGQLFLSERVQYMSVDDFSYDLEDISFSSFGSTLHPNSKDLIRLNN
uniref:PPM-type phosphatase domain-containing protein n=1 Tax=Timspurckia oligopyrenoides TaxID=708627 RepID=A0A7S1ER58_9RHOD|mmetsp:Transcript_200/g.340  ORF Transcript_200/g.340 Transcript_200/m.340 type:complete len:471 (+) Transcript_200:112-1524(+)